MARCPVTLRHPPQKGSRLACSRRGPKPSDCAKSHPAHRTCLGFWLRFGLSPLLTTARSLLLQRFFVRTRDFSHTFPCVSLLGMNKTGATLGRFYPFAAIYAVIESLSRPIVGHTPRKLPRWASNLPHHRTCAHRRSIIIQQSPLQSQENFMIIFQVFSTVLPPFVPPRLCTLPKAPSAKFPSGFAGNGPARPLAPAAREKQDCLLGMPAV